MAIYVRDGPVGPA